MVCPACVILTKSLLAGMRQSLSGCTTATWFFKSYGRVAIVCSGLGLLISIAFGNDLPLLKSAVKPVEHFLTRGRCSIQSPRGERSSTLLHCIIRITVTKCIFFISHSIRGKPVFMRTYCYCDIIKVLTCREFRCVFHTKRRFRDPRSVFSRIVSQIIFNVRKSICLFPR